jgi:O-antigen/teichoic acid export membrane protein
VSRPADCTGTASDLEPYPSGAISAVYLPPITDPVPPAALLPSSAASPTSAGAVGSRTGELLRGSSWLVATVAMNAIGGFAFWLVAARLSGTDELGRTAALFSSALFVIYAVNLGLPVAVARFSPDRSLPSRTLYTWALLVTISTAGVGAGLFFLVAPSSLVEPLRGHGSFTGLVVFVITTAGVAASAIVDVRFMTLRYWGWVFARTSLVSVTRVALLLVPGVREDVLWLFVVVAGVPAVTGFAGVAVANRYEAATWRLRPLPSMAAAAMRYAAINYMGLLALQAPFMMVPLVVLLNVSPDANANFYIAWSIAALVFLVPQTIAQVLLVEGGKDGSSFQRQTLLAFALAGGLALLATAATAPLAQILPSLYGTGFEDTERLITPLVAASIPWAITSVCLTDARVRADTLATVIITAGFAVAILVPTVSVVGDAGVEGVAVAWLAGNVTAAVLSLGTYGVRRRHLQHTDPTGQSIARPVGNDVDERRATALCTGADTRQPEAAPLT